MSPTAAKSTMRTIFGPPAMAMESSKNTVTTENSSSAPGCKVRSSGLLVHVDRQNSSVSANRLDHLLTEEIGTRSGELHSEERVAALAPQTQQIADVIAEQRNQKPRIHGVRNVRCRFDGEAHVAR